MSAFLKTSQQTQKSRNSFHCLIWWQDREEHRATEAIKSSRYLLSTRPPVTITRQFYLSSKGIVDHLCVVSAEISPLSAWCTIAPRSAFCWSRLIMAASSGSKIISAWRSGRMRRTSGCQAVVVGPPNKHLMYLKRAGRLIWEGSSMPIFSSLSRPWLALRASDSESAALSLQLSFAAARAQRTISGLRPHFLEEAFINAAMCELHNSRSPRGDSKDDEGLLFYHLNNNRSSQPFIFFASIDIVWRNDSVPVPKLKDNNVSI